MEPFINRDRPCRRQHCVRTVIALAANKNAFDQNVFWHRQDVNRSTVMRRAVQFGMCAVVKTAQKPKAIPRIRFSAVEINITCALIREHREIEVWLNFSKLDLHFLNFQLFTG